MTSARQTRGSRAIGWVALASVAVSALASTGCHAVAQGIGESLTFAFTVVGLVAVVVCLGLGVALARGTDRPRLGFAFAGTALILVAWASFALFVTAESGIPLDVVGHRLALVPLALLPIPVAAMRGRMRVGAIGVVGVLACVYLVLVVLVRPGSRLPAGRAIDVAVGHDALCALFDEGGVACVGDNTLGQMGVGDGHATHPWALALPLPPVDAIDGAGSAFCARTSAGETWCWGETYGFAPVRVATAAFTPAPVLDDTNAACRIDAAGRVFCGERAIALPGPAARLRGTRGLVCVAESERRGVLCWGTTEIVRLHGAPRQTQPPDLIGLFGPRWAWSTPSEIDWP